MLARSKKNDAPSCNTIEEDTSHQNLCWRIYQVLHYLILLAKDFFSITPRDKPTFNANEKSTPESQPKKKFSQNKSSTNSSLHPKKPVKDIKNSNQSFPSTKVSGVSHHYSFYSKNNDPYHFYTPTYAGIPASARRTTKRN